MSSKNVILMNTAGDQIYPATTAEQVAYDANTNVKQAIDRQSGHATVANEAADMTDQTAIYVYTGDETGYNFGHWYYYDGSAWTDGGAYLNGTDNTLSIAGMAADAKTTGDEISDLKNALYTNTVSLFAVSVGVESGYWAIANGTPTISTTWCRSKTFIPNSYSLTVSTIYMFLVAYNKNTGTYVGTWNGSTFVTSYNFSLMSKRFFDISDFSRRYPDYVFKIDFFANTADPLDVSTVLGYLTVEDHNRNKQDKTCNNLIGKEFETLYPVTLTQGQYLTFSTSDGAAIGGAKQTNIAFYDEYRHYINQYGFQPSVSYRTVGPLSVELASAKYIAMINGAPRVPLMINHGSTILPYEEYFWKSPVLTEELIKMQDSIGTPVFHKEDQNAVYAIKRHYGGNDVSADNDFKALVISDIHEEIIRTNRMVELINSWGSDYFDIALNTGDTVLTVFSQDISWYENAVSESNIPILNTVGNHDAYENLTGALVNKVDVYNKFIAPVAANTSITQPTGASANGLNYYYKDVGGVRVVVLDCMYWDASELSWFEAVLADAITNEIPVIACSHAPFASTYCQLLDSPWNVGWFHRDSTLTNIAAAEAVQTFVNNGGSFICWLMGHIHGDEIETLPNYGDQLVICTNTFQDRGTTVVKNTDLTAYNYDSLTYLTVDTVNTSVKLYRIGANIDTAGHKRNGFVWNYDTKQLVTEW